MINIDIFKNKELLFNFGAVRILPKYCVEKGEMCTYSLFVLDEKEKLNYIDKKIYFPYGDILELSFLLVEEFQKEYKELNYYLDKTDSLKLNISINRDKYTHQFLLCKENKKYNLYFIPNDENEDKKIRSYSDLKITNKVLKDVSEILKLMSISIINFDKLNISKKGSEKEKIIKMINFLKELE